MRLAIVLTALASATALTSPCFAAGNGAGAGGAGHQRAINSGLPAGEAGPPGSPNNPRPAAEPRDAARAAPRSDDTPAR